MTKEIFKNVCNPDQLEQDWDCVTEEYWNQVVADYRTIYDKLMVKYEAYLKCMAKPETKQKIRENAKKYYHEHRTEVIKTPEQLEKERQRQELIDSYPNYNAYYYHEVRAPILKAKRALKKKKVTFKEDISSPSACCTHDKSDNGSSSDAKAIETT